MPEENFSMAHCHDFSLHSDADVLVMVAVNKLCLYLLLAARRTKRSGYNPFLWSGPIEAGRPRTADRPEAPFQRGLRAANGYPKGNQTNEWR